MSKHQVFSHDPLSQSDEHLRLLDAAGLAYTIKDRNYNLQFVSNSFFSILDLEPSDSLQTDFDLYIPEIAYELGQEDSIVLTSRQPKELDRVLITLDGHELIAKISSSVVEIENQTYIVSIYRDITTEKQSEQFEEYKKTLSDTEVYEKMINRFTSLIFNSNDKQDIFENVGALCVDLLDLEDISFFEADAKNEILNQVLIVEKGKNILYNTVDKPFLSIPFTIGISGKCAREKSTVIVNDISLDSHHVSDRVDCKSEIAVPIIYRDRLLGVIDSESTIKARYSTSIGRTLEGVASLLAIKLNELDNYRELNDKTTKLTSFLQNSPAPIAMLDMNGNYIVVSDEWKKTYKQQGDKLIGKNHFEENPNLPLRWIKMIGQAYKGQSQRLEKESYRRKSGKVHFYSAKVNPWYTSENEMGGVVIIAEDVTLQVNRDVKLSQTSEQLEETRRYGKFFNWEFNPETGYILWEKKAMEMVGISSDEQITLDKFFQYIDKNYHADFNKELMTAIQSKSSFSFIHPFRIKDLTFWIHTRGKVICEGDKIDKIEGIAQDITSQVDAEKAYRLQNIELKKINDELDQFVYKTAHDLRAPLTNLLGLIGIMRNEDNLELLNSYYDLQEKSIEKLDSFIYKITDYTKNTRLPKQRNLLNFNNLIDKILGEFNYFSNSEKIEKLVTIDTPNDVYGDATRLSIILNNLISNSIKFADLKKNKPKIEISITSDSSNLIIEVTDNGLGIPKELQHRVFEMFYRAHSIADGAGVGLYIVKETVDKLNGKINVSSIDGKETSITIHIPNN